MGRASVRRQVLDSAMELFYNQGYTSTGIQQIADNANVAKTSLYAHFTSKEDLCVAYLSETREEWLNALAQYASSAKGVKDWVFKAFDFLGFSAEQENFRGCSFLNIMGELPTDSHRILKEVVITKNRLREMFRVQFVATDHEDLSDAVYVLFEGAMTEVQVQKSTWPIKEAVYLLSKIF